MQKKVDILQAQSNFFTGVLQSLNDDTKEQEDKIELDNCGLEFFSFDKNEVSDALKEDLDEEKRRKIANHLLKLHFKDKLANLGKRVAIKEEQKWPRI